MGYRDLNHSVLIGRLVRDPEGGYTPNQKQYANFSIACNRAKDEADFFDIVCWEKTADIVMQWARKGQQVSVSGRLRQERFKTKEGDNRTKIVLSANDVQLIGRAPGAQESNAAPQPRVEEQSPKSQPAASSDPQTQPEFYDEDDPDNIFNEDVK